MYKYISVMALSLGVAACNTHTYDPMKNNADSATDVVSSETFDNGAVLKTLRDGTKVFTVPDGQGLFF